AVTALLLSFVLSVSIPAPAGDSGLRVLGWLLAGAASTAAALVLWPRFERAGVRKLSSDALHKVALLISALRNQSGPGIETFRSEAQAAYASLQHRFSAMRKRPAGPMRRDRALVELMAEIERTLRFTGDPFHSRLPLDHPCLGEGGKLAAEVHRILDQSADVLVGGPTPNFSRLQEARFDHRSALDRWAFEQLAKGTPAARVMEGLVADDA